MALVLRHQLYRCSHCPVDLSSEIRSGTMGARFRVMKEYANPTLPYSKHQAVQTISIKNDHQAVHTISMNIHQAVHSISMKNIHQAVHTISTYEEYPSSSAYY